MEIYIPMKHPKRLAILGGVLLLALLSPFLMGAEPKAAPTSLNLPAGADAAAKAIARDSLEAPIRYLADDLLEGRGPASRGDTLARLYLATALESLGYQPGAAGGGWQQPFDMVGITSEVPKTWEFQAGGKTVPLKWWDDFIAASGVQSPTSTISDAELVFVGYGIQ